MKITPSAALKPLDLSRKPHGTTRQLAPRDLSPEARLMKAAPTQHDRIRKQTEKWVSQTFFGTLLKQMGESPFKSELFSGGRGGEAFQGLYNQQLVDRSFHIRPRDLAGIALEDILRGSAHQLLDKRRRHLAGILAIHSATEIVPAGEKNDQTNDDNSK